jgi:putative ABC transport system permease protein
VEIGLAFLLTAGAALMIQTFTNLMSQGPGYDARGVLTLTTSVTSSKYANHRIQYYRDAEDRLKRIAGIESVAFSSLIPMDYTDVAPLFREDRPTPGAKAPLTDYISVSTDYFRVMRIPILRGRLFTEQDNEKSPKIALINEACARAQFPGEDPIGKRIRLGAPDDDAKTVVGIVGDVRQDGIDRPADMQVYMPLNQDAIVGFYRMLARTAGDPARLEPTVRAAFTEVDRESPVYHVKALEEYVAGRLANRRFALVLLALFGALSLMLAAVGVYGVMSYTISLRTREIGVRMALGADASATVLLVLRRSMATTAAGVALGWLGALGLARSISALLYKVRPADPMTLGGVAILLALVALAASTLPARRAARIDPITALRQE